MLNRRHVRVKVMQALYGYYSAGEEKNLRETQRELEKNLNRLYDLYLSLLLFLRELIYDSERYDEEIKSKFLTTNTEKGYNTRFYSNAIAQKLCNSELFEKELSKHLIAWNSEQNDLLRKIFADLKNSEVYNEYNRSTRQKESEDIEIFSYIIKHYPSNFSLLEQFLEDSFINWWDDAYTAQQMVIKSVKKIITEPEDENFLQPFTTDEGNPVGFAKDLMEKILLNSEEAEKRISARIEKWDTSRIALLDMIILKIGITEFISFPNIPTKVTINECIELAKNYSTPNSKKFINGLLDNILEDLKSAGLVQKSGIGLLDN